MKNGCCVVCKIVRALAAIGALNWGLVGVFNFNLVDTIFGMGSALSRIVYALVGLSGIILILSFFKSCPSCKKS